MFSLSVLDLVPIRSGGSASQAIKETVELAQRAEELGYVRYWFAEHHGMRGIASSSPEVLIAHIATATKRIRVGSGGIMLPNHTPLRVAEAFHTLEALHPGRIDFGIGRAPGTDPATSQALRPFGGEQFPRLLKELISLSNADFPQDHPFHSVRVVPDDVKLPPIWLLGSSGASAKFAGSLGLGYGFASHFSATPPAPATNAYRESFQPSDAFERPHVIVGAAVFCADTKEEADHLAKSMDLSWVRLRSGQPGRLPSPEEADEYSYTPFELNLVRDRRTLSIVGNPTSVRDQIEALAQASGADEVMITSMIYDHAARVKSFELVAEVFDL